MAFFIKDQKPEEDLFEAPRKSLFKIEYKRQLY